MSAEGEPYIGRNAAPRPAPLALHSSETITPPCPPRRRLNSMDLALYARAEVILTEHRTQWEAEGKLEQLPPRSASAVSASVGAGRGRNAGRNTIPKPKGRRNSSWRP